MRFKCLYICYGVCPPVWNLTYVFGASSRLPGCIIIPKISSTDQQLRYVASNYGTRSPIQENTPRTKTTLNHTGEYPSHQNHIEQLDIGGCMGTIPQDESISNYPMRHREFFKMALLVCLICLRALISKNMRQTLADMFLRVSQGRVFPLG